MGDPTLEAGADCEMALGGGGIRDAVKALLSMVGIAAPAEATCCDLLLRLEFGLLCILECLVNSSDRLNRFVHPGYWQA